MAQFSNSNLMLASAGNVVKIWNSSTFEMCSQLKVKNISFQSVRWSSDCSQTISIPDRGEKIILSRWPLNSRGEHIERLIEGCCVAQFSSTASRFLGVGTKTGSTMIYDVKHKTLLKTFGPAKSAVTCLQYNWNDSYIACGYADGSLMLHNSNTGQSSSPLVTKSTDKISSLGYSYTKKSLVGCCSESGEVMLWDANTRQLCARFCEHLAPATGLQFSPTNPHLLVSIGLDKKIQFYDTTAKKAIRTMDSEAPLCSLDFKEDGFTLAVGCTKGMIYFYDLKSPLFPYHTIKAHTSSVQSLSFQNTVVSAASKEKVKRNESTRMESNESYDVSKYITSRESDLGSISINIDASRSDAMVGNRKKDSLTAEIFSPIRESASFANDTNRSTRNSTFFENSNFSFAFTTPLQDQKVPTNSTKFPGGKKTTAEIKHAASVTTKKSPPSLQLPTKSITVDVNENISTKNKNGSLKQQLFKSPLSPQSVSALGICSRSGDCSSAAAWSCNPKDLQPPKEDSQEEAIVFQQPKLVENVTVPNDYNTRTSLPNNCCSHTPTPKTPECATLEHSGNKNNNLLVFETSDSTIDEGKGTSKSTTPMTPQGFQAEFFKQLMVDAMEEHTDNIRRFLYQFHVQMARDFERQSEHLEEIFMRNSASPDNINEMRRRREDCYLQNIFR